MTDAAVLERIDQLTSAVQTLSTILGARLTRAQLCERLGVSDNTLRKRVFGTWMDYLQAMAAQCGVEPVFVRGGFGDDGRAA